MTLTLKNYCFTLGLIAVSVWSGVTFRLAVLLSAFCLLPSAFAAQILIVPPPPLPAVDTTLPPALQWLAFKTPTNLVTACGISNSDPNYQPVIVDLSNWPNL